MNNDILTMKELAEYLRLNEKTAYRFVAEGKIPGFKIGSSWRFRLSDINEWIDQKKSASNSARRIIPS